jgi:hypothetical protein
MKTTIRAFIFTLLFAAFGVFFSYGARVMLGTDAETATTERFSTYLTDAKAMFIEKPDAFQMTALNYMNMPGAELVNGKNGSAEEDYGLFGDYATAVNGRVYNVAVTTDGVMFYTKYDSDGTVGIIYEFRENASPGDYEIMELLEEWKLFYKITD